MKKIKFITGLTVLATVGTTACVLASCGSSKGTVDLDKSVSDQGVSVKSSSIQQGKDSTIELTLPEGKTISAITLKVGDTTLSKSDVTVSGSTISIPAAKMTSNKVTITSITLSDPVTPTVSDVKITNKPTSVTVNNTFQTSATISYANADQVTWSYTSSDGGKVSFDGLDTTKTASGVSTTVKGVTKGTVTITAKYDDTHKDSFTLTVAEAGEVVITNFAIGSKITSTFTSAKVNSISVSPSSPKVSFTVSTKDKTADVEGHFVIYKTAGTILGYTDKEVLPKATETINRLIEITTWTGLTSSDTLTVEWVDESVVSAITVSGTHNVDINDSTTLEFKAIDQYGNDVTSSCTFNSSEPGIAYFKSGEHKLTLIDAKTSGGSLTITATYSPANGNAITDDIEIEIATFDKLLADGTEYSLQKGYAQQANASTSGSIVLPTKYWDKDLSGDNKWVTTDHIYGGGFNNDGITSIYVSSTITTIGDQPFNKGLTSIVVNSHNTTYKSKGKVSGTEQECNAIMSLDGTALLFGCANTAIPDDGTLTSIESNAFFNSGITSVSIPASVTTIGFQAFYLCKSLATVTFAGTSTCEAIGSGAFQFCSLLTTIAIPASVGTIYANAFADCSQLTTITLPTSSKWIQIGDNEKKQLNVSTVSTNATNLKETSSTKENNWGKTGIKVDSGAVLSAKVKYDNTFSTNNIAVNDITESVLKGTTDTIAIKTTNNGTEAISGKIIFKNSASTPVQIGSIDVTYTAGQVRTTDSITLDTTAWGKISPQDTITASFEKQTAKTASYAADDISFTTAGINLTTHTGTIIEGSEDEVSLHGLATAGDVTGTFIITGTNGEIARAENQTFTGSGNKVGITLTTEQWENVEDGETLTVSFEKDEVTKTLTFDTTEWTDDCNNIKVTFDSSYEISESSKEITATVTSLTDEWKDENSDPVSTITIQIKSDDLSLVIGVGSISTNPGEGKTATVTFTIDDETWEQMESTTVIDEVTFYYE